MTQEQIAPYVEAGLHVFSKHKMYKIAGINRTGPKFDKFYTQLSARFFANAKVTFKLMRELIDAGYYPTCHTCGHPIKNSDRYAPDGLTMGRLDHDIDSHHISNVGPEHGECNWDHGKTNIQQELLIPCAIHIEIKLGKFLQQPSRSATYRPFEGLDIAIRQKSRERES